MVTGPVGIFHQDPTLFRAYVAIVLGSWVLLDWVGEASGLFKAGNNANTI